jgi:hypothetical protein
METTSGSSQTELFLPYLLTRKKQMKIKLLVSLIAALFSTGLSDLSISYAAEPEVATVKDFKWGD